MAESRVKRETRSYGGSVSKSIGDARCSVGCTCQSTGYPSSIRAFMRLRAASACLLISSAFVQKIGKFDDTGLSNTSKCAIRSLLKNGRVIPRWNLGIQSQR